MFGSKCLFLYDECENCGSIQLSELPDALTLAEFYPSHYYSFSGKANAGNSRVRRALKSYIDDRRDKAVFGQSQSDPF